MPGPVNMIDPVTGNTYSIAEEDVTNRLARKWTVEDDESAARRLSKDARDEVYDTPVGKFAAAGTGALRTVTGGASDAALGAIGGSDTLRNLKEANPGASLAGELGGALLPTGIVGAASKAGKAVSGLGGASTVGKIAGAAAGAATEGAIIGAGHGVSELALSRDPLTLERAASTISTSALFGGAVGAGVGAAAKGLQLGLSKAARQVERLAATEAKAATLPDDLARLDRKGLRAAEEAELATIETSRVAQRKQVADDLAAEAKRANEEKVWLSMEGVEGRDYKVIRKQSLNATRQLDRALDNPKYLAENPKTALAALQKQEHALEQLAAKGEELRPSYAADSTPVRATALDNVAGALERNRSLQTRIRELTSAPSSSRLSAIQDAKDVLSAPAPPKSIAEQMAGGSAYSLAAGAASAVPVIGPMLAPFAGAAASSVVGQKIFGRLGKAVSERAAQHAKSIETFLDTSGRVAKSAPVLATRVLSSARFAPGDESSPSKGATLAGAFKARAAEIRSQVTAGPDGGAVMRPEAREALAAKLAPIRAASPQIADRIETVQARKFSFLANKLRQLAARPDVFALQDAADQIQPSDMAMRAFARYVEAAENPDQIVDRLASGAVTPEDAETMREVYPELYADTVQQILSNLTTLRESLPYHRRLSLSIFSGVPVDAAMHPMILGELQSAFTSEPNTDGGVKPPTPQPQFGSVKAEKPTPAQSRAG